MIDMREYSIRLLICAGRDSNILLICADGDCIFRSSGGTQYCTIDICRERHNYVIGICLGETVLVD